MKNNSDLGRLQTLHKHGSHVENSPVQGLLLSFIEATCQSLPEKRRSNQKSCFHHSNFCLPNPNLKRKQKGFTGAGSDEIHRSIGVSREKNEKILKNRTFQKMQGFSDLWEKTVCVS